jgi:hypothetical protein
MDSPLVLLGFLSIFHVVGAVALANGLRAIWDWLRGKERRPGNGPFFIVWGTMFGCIPFASGLGLVTDKEKVGTPLLLLGGEVIVWGTAFLITLFFGDDVVDWLRPFLHPHMYLVGFGGIFMLVGAAVGSFMIRDDILFGLLFGGIFLLVGGVIFALGVWNLLKEITRGVQPGEF